MDEKERRAEYDKIFENVEPGERRLIDRLIGECVWLECQMLELKKLPFIRVNPKDPALQKTTPAARLYKEYATSYMNGVRLLLNTLRKVESSAQDELLSRLAEFGDA